MKYENFEKVKDIVRQIHSLVCTLNDLESSNLSIDIKAGGGYGHIMTIGAYSKDWPHSKDWEHSYSELAGNFIDAIKTDYKNRIDQLHKELEAL